MERQIIIKTVSPTQLAIACTFESIESALAALDAARAKIVAGEVPMHGRKGIEVVSQMPKNLESRS